jgi:hypothetical protein
VARLTLAVEHLTQLTDDELGVVVGGHTITYQCTEKLPTYYCTQTTTRQGQV